MKWTLLHPELYYLLTGGVFLVLALLRGDSRRNHLLALVFSAVGVGVCMASLPLAGDLFSGTYRVDLFSQSFKVVLSIGLFLIVTLCGNLAGVADRYRTEFYFLLFGCTLSMLLLVGSVHLLTVYVSLELSSYSLYLMVSLRRRREEGVSTALNYFIIGASASAVTVFGMAIVYGTTHSVQIVDLMQQLPGVMHRPLVLTGYLFMLAGFLFKLAVFPFHFWAPDAYEGAPHQVAAYIATASKVAAIAILMRMVALSGGNSDALAHILVVLAVVSMTVGNLSALVQRDFKRLLAYSSVAHAGYVLIGLLSMSPAGYAASAFYAAALLLMKFACFLVVVLVAGDGDNITVSRLAGLHHRAPLPALALMMALFGLAGIPPTVGFTGKLMVFTAAMERGYLWLVIIAMINVVISLYYYLIVLKAAYLDAPAPDAPQAAYGVSPAVNLLSGCLVLAIVIGGIFPVHLMAAARAAVSVLIP